MQIRTRMSMSADGYVTTPGGWPALTADPSFVPGQSHGIREFLEGTEAALMGRVTFEPALNNDRWPWPNLDVFVLCSERPPGTLEHVVTDSDPLRLLERMRAANRGGDVHLVGGPRTIESFRAIGALDELQLVVLPLVFGSGMRLTDSLSPETGLTFKRSRELPGRFGRARLRRGAGSERAAGSRDGLGAGLTAARRFVAAPSEGAVRAIPTARTPAGGLRARGAGVRAGSARGASPRRGGASPWRWGASR